MMSDHSIVNSKKRKIIFGTFFFLILLNASVFVVMTKCKKNNTDSICDHKNK